MRQLILRIRMKLQKLWVPRAQNHRIFCGSTKTFLQVKTVVWATFWKSQVSWKFVLHDALSLFLPLSFSSCKIILSTLIGGLRILYLSILLLALHIKSRSVNNRHSTSICKIDRKWYYWFVTKLVYSAGWPPSVSNKIPWPKYWVLTAFSSSWAINDKFSFLAHKMCLPNSAMQKVRCLKLFGAQIF